jgi:large subunit ribosomal protein L25
VLRILHSDPGANTLISLKLDGGESRVMVQEYQLDPVTHQLLHADFYQLAMDKAITSPCRSSARASRGREAAGRPARLRHPRHRGASACRPTFPSTSTSTSRADAAPVDSRARPAENPKWKPVSDADTMLVHVVMPKAEESAAPARRGGCRAAPAEPEVIKKGKTDKEGREEKK